MIELGVGSRELFISFSGFCSLFLEKSSIMWGEKVTEPKASLKR